MDTRHGDALGAEEDLDGARGDARFDLAAGEAIRTEYSHKYTVDGFHELCAAAGWRPEEVWMDEKGWFAVHLLRRP